MGERHKKEADRKKELTVSQKKKKKVEIDRNRIQEKETVTLVEHKMKELYKKDIKKRKRNLGEKKRVDERL